MILVSMEEETLPYTMVPNNNTLGLSISVHKGGGNHLPLVNHVTKKGLVGLELKLIHTNV